MKRERFCINFYLANSSQLMHPNNASLNKTHKIELEHKDYAKSAFGNPIIKEADAYFGAKGPSTDTLMEEFGFVPQIKQIQIDGISHPDQAMNPVWDEADDWGFKFLPNEYEILSNQFQNDQENDKKFTLKEITTESKKGEKRETFRNISNSFNPSKILIQPENVTRSVDQEMDKELQALIESLEQQPIYIREENRPLMDYCLEINKSGIKPTLDSEKRSRRFPGDLYTPLWVRGKGSEREGLCELCCPGVWLKIKQSAYWYHMNFLHGISANTGRPYDPPTAFRQVPYRRHASQDLDQVEGLCRECGSWISLCVISSKKYISSIDDENGINVTWWRHVQKCTSKRNLPLTNSNQKKRKFSY